MTESKSGINGPKQRLYKRLGNPSRNEIYSASDKRAAAQHFEQGLVWKPKARRGLVSRLEAARTNRLIRLLKKEYQKAKLKARAKGITVPNYERSVELMEKTVANGARKIWMVGGDERGNQKRRQGDRTRAIVLAEATAITQRIGPTKISMAAVRRGVAWRINQARKASWSQLQDQEFRRMGFTSILLDAWRNEEIRGITVRQVLKYLPKRK